MKNPFAPAQQTNRRLKVLVYGPAGIGKTWFALDTPRPTAMIDLEGGSAHYGNHPIIGGFDRVATRLLKEIEDAVAYVETNGQYETLVVDPVTVLWQLLQDAGMSAAKRRNERARNKKTDDEISLAQADWGRIKQRLNVLFTRLNNLPCNVVLVARQKDLVEQDQYNNLRVVGVKPDCEKTTEYNLDVVLRLERRGKERVAVVEKDRTGTYQQGDVVQDPSLSRWLKAQAGGQSFRLQREDQVDGANAATLDTPAERPAPTPVPRNGNGNHRPPSPPKADSHEDVLAQELPGWDAPHPNGPEEVPTTELPAVDDGKHPSPSWNRANRSCRGALTAAGWSDETRKAWMDRLFGVRSSTELTARQLELLKEALEQATEPPQEAEFEAKALAPQDATAEVLRASLRQEWQKISPWGRLLCGKRIMEKEAQEAGA